MQWYKEVMLFLCSEHTLDVNQASAVLMSPVHHSSSNVQTSSSIEDHTNALTSPSQDGAEGAVGGTIGLLQRSTSMPPSVFDNERSYPRRDRVRVCIRENRGSARAYLDNRRFSPSRSLEVVGGEEEERELDPLECSYAPRRTNAAWERRRVIRRPPPSDEGIHCHHPPPAPPPPPLPVTVILHTGEERERESGSGAVLDAVKSKLLEEGHLALVEVADKLPKELQEAILVDSLPASCYESLSQRVSELRRGHLASGEEDASPGAIHWFEGVCLPL